MGKPLPNRTSIVITRNKDYMLPEGHFAVNSLQEAIQLCISKHLSQVFVLGGAEIYSQALPLADELMVTEVQAEPDGDAFFPEIDPVLWQKTSEEHYSKDEQNQYDFDFVIYHRRKA